MKPISHKLSDVLEQLKCGNVTAAGIARALDINRGASSSRLKQLRNKGLVRSHTSGPRNDTWYSYTGDEYTVKAPPRHVPEEEESPYFELMRDKVKPFGEFPLTARLPMWVAV